MLSQCVGVANSLIDALLPEECPGCGFLGPGVGCIGCIAPLSGAFRRIKPPSLVAAAWSLGDYEGIAGRLIRQGKYRHDPRVFKRLAAHLCARCDRLPAVDVVTWVPTHWRRRLSRGFDQAQLLANPLGETMGVPVTRLLTRVTSGAQVGRSGRDRNVAISAAFTAQENITSKRVLLVDDVITTGSTATACARALSDRGVEWIGVICVADVDRAVCTYKADNYRSYGLI